MQEIADTAVGFPTVTFTAALVVIAGFWLRVLLGRIQRDSFDSDVATDAPGGYDLPVAAAASFVIALAWMFSLGGSVFLRRSEIPGLLYALLAVTVLVGSVALAYVVTRVAMWASHSEWPDLSHTDAARNRPEL
ncbi:hypothetical protein [Streptomyces sp. NPDC088794]|uniref:hypothetical protein n=1 Tax=Streptomyces sp. NPDC088794 TaxID=3365902 RepID=UPI0037F4EF15